MKTFGPISDYLAKIMGVFRGNTEEVNNNSNFFYFKIKLFLNLNVS